MENVKTNYYGQSFCEVMGEKGEKMLFIVSIITFMVVLLIKGNNTLVNSFGSNGTLISYWIAFIIFIFLLAIGVGILVKYGIDIYPYFTVQSIAEENEKNDLNAIENNEREEKEEFVFKRASTLAPIETVNPVTVEKESSTSTPVDNGMVINPVIATAGMAPPIMAELLMMEDGNQEDDVIISSSDDDGFGYFGDAEDDILWNDPSMF